MSADTPATPATAVSPAAGPTPTVTVEDLRTAMAGVEGKCKDLEAASAASQTAQTALASSQATYDTAAGVEASARKALQDSVQNVVNLAVQAGISLTLPQ